MAIVLQSERLDLNQSNVITLNWVQISINEWNSARIFNGGLNTYKITGKEPKQWITIELSSNQDEWMNE